MSKDRDIAVCTERTDRRKGEMNQSRGEKREEEDENEPKQIKWRELDTHTSTHTSRRKSSETVMDFSY